MIGAGIVAVHVPSGTRYRAVTNTDGRFVIQGMRPGGPYTVTVSYIGYATRRIEKLSLELGNALPLNITMKENDMQLGEAMVTVSAKPKGGGAKNFTSENIQNTASIDHSINDVVRNMPMVASSKTGGVTIAGINNRYNSFQIDGVVANDVFGLSAGGTNGGMTGANPISMDAIQEIQVVVAPYDVRQGGFTGGGINAVTKQGTNEYKGSAYTYFNNQNMYGKYDAAHGNIKSPLTQKYERTYGGTLGGAIVKDKLFFFVSAEGKRETSPSTYYAGCSSDYISVATAKQIADRYAALTGFKESWGQRDVERKSFGLLARIDWNINEKHKLALRFQHNDSFKDSYGANSGTYTFVNSALRFTNKTNSIVAELNSHFSDVLYNEFRASANIIRDNREVPYKAANVYIQNVEGGDGKNYHVNIGSDYSAAANWLDQDIYNIEDNLSYYLGRHTLTFGTHNEFYHVKELFLQGAYGAWSYSTLSDFLNDTPYQYRFGYTDPDLVGSTQYAPPLKSGQFGFYAQDKWVMNNEFNLTYGIRFDIPVVFNSPMENPEFNQFAEREGLGVRVGEKPSAKFMVSPRVGFNWYTGKSHNTLVRGGVGVFTGRVPLVWVINPFLNTGMDIKNYNINNKNGVGVPTMGQYAGDPLGAAQSVSTQGSVIATSQKSFKYPQLLRANLAVEQHLPGDVKLTLEGIYSKTLNDVYFENLALINPNGEKVYTVDGVEASAAPRYSLRQSAYNSIINLKNTSRGYTYAITARAEKHFAFGLDLSAAYTYGRARSVCDGTSSTAYSGWQYTYSVDANSRKGELGYAKFDIPHRVNVQVYYTSPKYWNNWMSTTIGITYNGSNGGRYTLCMNESVDYNGDGARGNTLLYIPTDAELDQMHFSSSSSMSAEQNREAFRQWIQNDSYAKDHRGQYAKRYSNLTPWENEINLHLGQTIYNPQGIGKLEFTLDIMNFANMLNKKWGATYGNVYSVAPLKLDAVTNNGDGTYSSRFSYNSNNAVTKASVNSRWHCQVGFRLTF